ncbi:MAG: hypothetical protein Q4F13_11405 [Pseudomonadota bacterium]|nr:hypothetical protein [Pseudomonadota bacterium]
MSRPAIALLAFLLALAAGAVGFWRGDLAGQAKARAAQDAQTVQQLTRVLDEHQALVKQAQEASQALRRAAAARAQADSKTTQELIHALAQTADTRAGCVLPAGVVRQLDAARERAAAAAASGLAGAVPAAAGKLGR